MFVEDVSKDDNFQEKKYIYEDSFRDILVFLSECLTN